ncbi:hypothetical protein WJX72_000624 [[Myrmecia] bisecta]|uniref:Uncharacterized protein n=1 Tax=[Myrmecia] bisecta TaxID=41462 RepID=A0AAW1QNY1_9CHLO
MFNPQTPWAAGAIFLAGIAVIVYTTLDINRTTRLNERPMTADQTRALAEYVQHVQDKSAEETLRRLSGEGK